MKFKTRILLLKAFSLLELMIALVVISCATAVLTPVITKRLSSNTASIGTAGEVTTDCADFSNDCNLCNEDGCLVCKNTCASGQYLNVIDCKCEACTSNCELCTSSSVCIKCNKGYKLDGNSCVACAEGTYGGDGYTCTPCPVGQYQNATAKSTCKLCPKGKYASTTGSKTCASCTAGTYSEFIGSVGCKKCLPGYYQDKEGQESCVQCPRGTYQNDMGKTSCLECIQDSYCPKGSTMPITCGGNLGANPGSSKCEFCEDPYCLDCAIPSFCIECFYGFTLTSSGTCVLSS